MAHDGSQSHLNAECSSMKTGKRTVRKRFSKFISKMIWNLSQATPTYSSNGRHATSNDKHTSNSDDDQQGMDDTKTNPMARGIQYRKRSMLRRTSTLMSIKEENEIEEFMDCT